MEQNLSQINIPFKNCKGHDNNGIQLGPSSNNSAAYNYINDFSATSDNTLYATIPIASSNNKRYSTPSLATNATLQYSSHPFIGHNVSDQRFSPNAPQMKTNNSEITFEIPGYKIIIIPTTSPSTSFANLNMQQNNIHSDSFKYLSSTTTNGYGSILQHSSLPSQFGHNANVQQIIEQNSPNPISDFFSLSRIPPNMVNTNSSHLQQLQQNNLDSSYPLQFSQK